LHPHPGTTSSPTNLVANLISNGLPSYGTGYSHFCDGPNCLSGGDERLHDANVNFAFSLLHQGDDDGLLEMFMQAIAGAAAGGRQQTARHTHGLVQCAVGIAQAIDGLGGAHAGDHR